MNTGEGNYGEYGAKDFLFQDSRVFSRLEDYGRLDTLFFNVNFATDK